MAGKKTSPGAAAQSRPWSEVFEQHRGWLRSIVWSRIREHAATEDVLQEVALAAAKSENRPQEPDRLAPWLYRVAVRQALLYRRKKGRERNFRQRLDGHAGQLPIHRPPPEPLDWLLAAEQQEVVRNAIQNLDRRDAEVLLLKYGQDWSYAEIAKHMGLSTSAVESRLHRARKRLRQRLMDVDSAAEEQRPESGTYLSGLRH